MPLVAGARLGPYEIVSPLGVGGMGEVYRATDTRLKRHVAVKVLPAEFAADPARLARFQREAEVLASLNHPLIGAIYGIEQSSAGTALVMELVEGATLADRIAQGPLPIDEALGIAAQIAEALEAAHEQGIVHRDLKPANIKLRDDGTVKVLDFGLAKTQDRSTSSSDRTVAPDLANSPTMASPHVSQAGVILGTAAYMSPEQARGRAVDKRSDVWAFGAVFYEMLSGARAFDGDDVTELIAAVVKSTPDWSKLPAATPRRIVTLIQQCLDKDRKSRIGDMAVVRFVMAGADAPAAPAVVATPTRASRAPLWMAVALLVGAALGWVLHRPAAPAPASMMFAQIPLQPADILTPSRSSGIRPSRQAFALSPDGRRIVFTGTKGNEILLYARDTDRPEASPMEGTDGGIAPFFSPDGNWVGFWAGSTIKKMPSSGGPPTTIADLPVGYSYWGASWGDNDTIYFAGREGVFRVSASGGTPEAITKPDLTRGDRHLLPRPLPGGRALLYTSPPNVMYRALDSNDEHVVVADAADARYVDGGYLVYMKSGALMGAPFDAAAGKINGDAVTLIPDVMQGINASNAGDETLAGQYSVSKAGHLVYVPGGITPSRLTTLVWVDRAGVAQPVNGVMPRPFLYPRLSPDGEHVAVEVRADTSRNADVWVYDVKLGSATRLTFDGGGAPTWSPDGMSVVVSAGGLQRLKADGSGKPERITTAEVSQTPQSWARGANIIAFLQRPTTETFGIFSLPMSGAPGKPELFLESKFVLRYPEISPDGKWLAYVSTESGTPELYVQAYPRGGNKIRVSTDGADEAIWLANGKELLFRSGFKFLSAAVRSAMPFRIDPPGVLFEAKPGEYDATAPIRSWDATADGRKFVIARSVPSKEQPVVRLNLIANWKLDLERRVQR
jgi:Tol biopolymer transport system component